MDGYFFWQDLFDTLQSFPDWLTLIALLIPPGLILGLAKIISTHRLTRARIMAEATAAASTAAVPTPPQDQLETCLWQELAKRERLEEQLANLLLARQLDEGGRDHRSGGDYEKRST